MNNKNNKYSKAYKEVLEIIKYFPEEEYNKIPKEKIAFFEQNMDIDYEFTIDPSIDLSEQNISKEANSIIIVLFEDYFATEKQKNKIKKLLEINQEKIEQEKREKYNPDDLFASHNTTTINKPEIERHNTDETALVEYKENFFVKFKNFIMKLLHIKNYD